MGFIWSRRTSKLFRRFARWSYRRNYSSRCFDHGWSGRSSSVKKSSRNVYSVWSFTVSSVSIVFTKNVLLKMLLQKIIEIQFQFHAKIFNESLDFTLQKIENKHLKKISLLWFHKFFIIYFWIFISDYVLKLIIGKIPLKTDQNGPN